MRPLDLERSKHVTETVSNSMSNYVEQTSSLASVAGLVRVAIEKRGLDAAVIFDECGIDVDIAADPYARVPTPSIHALWKRAVDATGDPYFGLAVAEQFQPAALHGLGFAWLASDTLRSALERLIRYSRFANPFLKISLQDAADTVDLVLVEREDWSGWVDAAADFGMAIILRMCRLTVGEPIVVVRTRLARPALASVEPFEALFGPAIEFAAGENRLCFERALADRHLVTANPELARLNDRSVVDYLARFDRADLAMRVRSCIIEQLPSGTPDQHTVAAALNLSRRSLQRKLQAEGTTFRSLLEETRRDLAVHYVTATRRSMAEVTYLLGFSEPSNFTRAFRRWTGTSPAEYRQHG